MSNTLKAALAVTERKCCNSDAIRSTDQHPSGNCWPFLAVWQSPSKGRAVSGHPSSTPLPVVSHMTGSTRCSVTSVHGWVSCLEDWLCPETLL